MSNVHNSCAVDTFTGKRARSTSIIDISSSEDERETGENHQSRCVRSTHRYFLEIPVKKHRHHAASPMYPHSASVIDISSGEDESETGKNHQSQCVGSTHKYFLEIPVKKRRRHAASPMYPHSVSVIDISSGEDESETGKNHQTPCSEASIAIF